MKKLLLAFVATLLFLTPAWGESASFLRVSGQPIENGFLKDWPRFCQDNPTECEVAAENTVVDFNKWYGVISGTNLRVNQLVEYATDQVIHGVDEYLGYPTLVDGQYYGDCDDYVLLKRRWLLDNGVPLGAMRIAAADTAAGEAHAVLLVSTSEGDLVLDNRFEVPMFVNESDLIIATVQAHGRENTWFITELAWTLIQAARAEK